MLPWLRDRVKKGDGDAETHTAFAKVLAVQEDITEAETFLVKDSIYQSKTVTKFCADKNKMELAFMAYKKGDSDDDRDLLKKVNHMR